MQLASWLAGGVETASLLAPLWLSPVSVSVYGVQRRRRRSGLSGETEGKGCVLSELW
jgi:hypothetical protein